MTLIRAALVGTLLFGSGCELQDEREPDTDQEADYTDLDEPSSYSNDELMPAVSSEIALGEAGLDEPLMDELQGEIIEIRSAFNNKCLEILGFHNENGAKVGVWDCWGGANQRWYWDGQQLRNVMNNKCLEILGFHNENGSHVGMWDCWGGANQRWYWDGQQLRNVMNNKCLEILSFNNSNGAQAGMWDCWGGANQRWY